MTQTEQLNKLARLKKTMAKYQAQADKFEDTRELLAKFGPKHDYWHLGSRITFLEKELGLAQRKAHKMKKVLISSVVTRWIEVPEGVDSEEYLYEVDGLFDGIDLNEYDATDFEVIEEETV